MHFVIYFTENIELQPKMPSPDNGVHGRVVTVHFELQQDGRGNKFTLWWRSIHLQMFWWIQAM